MRGQTVKRYKTPSLVLLGLVLILCLAGCGSPKYQFAKTQNGTTVALSIDPYPQKSLTPTVYTVKITRNNQPVKEDVSLDFQMPEMDMGDNLTKAEAKGEGIYVVKKNLTMSGKWQIIVKVAGEEVVFDTLAE